MTPELIYIKGQGWVYPSTHRIPITMGDGQSVILECRPPTKGERYRYTGINSEYSVNGIPVAYWLNYITSCHYDDCPISDGRVLDGYVYLTVLPCT